MGDPIATCRNCYWIQNYVRYLAPYCVSTQLNSFYNKINVLIILQVSEEKNAENTILPIPPPDIKPLNRNSDGHIIPNGPKLDQSQYAVVELKPKEERPKKRVNDSTHVYATFSNKVNTVG